MPRFHFNVCDGLGIKDVDGCELPDFGAARQEGVRLSGALIENEVDQFDVSDDWTIEVTDDTGLILFVMTFSIMQSSAVPTRPRCRSATR